MLPQIKTANLYYASLGLSVVLGLALVLTLTFGLSGRPAAIRRLHGDIGRLQEKLISAQITSQRLVHVQRLVGSNLALSARDTLAQGASLSFLKDLTAVLDKLKITLVSLEPEKVSTKAKHLETPYKMELLCNYNQFVQLVNKMEKSPRLISIKSFDVKNDVNNYFSDHKEALDQCPITLSITTLTLVKKAP